VILDGRDEVSRSHRSSVTIDGVAIGTGSRVRLHPRTTRTDVLMAAIDGRRAIVDAVLEDTDDKVRVTVTLEDDPARSLGKGRGLGHRFFLDPDEVEPLQVDEPGTDGSAPPKRILVAGIGNVFLGDDGFGVEVVQRLADAGLPDGVDAVDFGIRGIDLAFALGDGYDAAVLIDAAPRGQPPGTLEVIEPELDGSPVTGVQGHGLDPVAVLTFARGMNPLPERTLIVTCEPLHAEGPPGDELDGELSPPVRAAVDTAISLVRRIVTELVQAPDDKDEGGGR
jgi:hydrogenase maturation protease